MRVLFDTNVLVSAFTSSGLCHLAYEIASIRADLILSTRVLDEMQQTLVEKMGLEKNLAQEIRAELEINWEMIEPIALAKSVCRDKDDDWILAAALTGNAEIIVSGDKDLLVLKEFHGIKILSPRQFLELLNAK